MLTHTFEVDFAVEQALAVTAAMTETVTAVVIEHSLIAVAAVVAAVGNNNKFILINFHTFQYI